MRASHLDQIEKWANFVKNNPTQWKQIHTKFINALFEKHYQVRERILVQPDGAKKLATLHRITNNKGYNWLSTKNTQT